MAGLAVNKIWETQWQTNCVPGTLWAYDYGYKLNSYEGVFFCNVPGASRLSDLGKSEPTFSR